MIPARATVDTLTLTNANTEYTYTFPNGVKGYSLQPRAAVDVRMAFVTAKVAGSTDPYATIKGSLGQSFGVPANVEPRPQSTQEATGAGHKIFLASGTAGAVVEIVYWS